MKPLSEDERFQMASHKIGALFRLAAETLQSASSTTFNFVPLADIIGLIFQIRADYKGLSSTPISCMIVFPSLLQMIYSQLVDDHRKGCCEDLIEGEFSFPVIHSLKRPSRKNDLINILKMPTEDT